MNEASKGAMIAALRDFKKSYQKLNQLWQEDTEFDLNDTEAIDRYPFERSFDELCIIEWCEESIAEIGTSVSEDVTMLNPKCALCNGCKKIQVGSKDLYQCSLDVSGDCQELQIPFNRDAAIVYIVSRINATNTVEDIVLNGAVGLNTMSDVEIYETYLSLI